MWGVNIFGNYRFNSNPTDWAAVKAVVEANDREGLQRLVDTRVIPAPANVIQGLGDPFYFLPIHVLGSYVNDDWRINPNLTVNLGVRYDIEIGALLGSYRTRFLSRPDMQPRKNADGNNWAPRVGFVQALGSEKRTVVRGGLGRYYDQTYSNQGPQYTIHQDGDHYFQANVLYNGAPDFMTNPLRLYGGTIDGLIANNVPTDVRAISRDFEVTYTDQYSIGMEHQLSNTLGIQADVVHALGFDAFYTRDVNLFTDPATGEPLPVRTAGRPDPRFSAATVSFSDGRSRYDAFQFAATKRYSQRHQFQASYILSWTKDSGGGGTTPEPTQPISVLYGPSAGDQRHRFVLNGVAQLPYDVTVGAVFFAASGTRFQTNAGRDINGDLVSNDLARYPDGSKWPLNGGLSAPVYRIDLRLSKRVPALQVGDGRRDR